MSDQFPSTLRDLQEAITARLSSCSALAGIQVFDRRKADLETLIEEQLSGVGVTLFVAPVQLKNISPDVPAISSDDADFVVAIYENPPTNDTGRDAAALKEIVMRRLHQWQPGVEGVGVVTIDPNPEDDRSTKKKVIYDLTFRVSVTLEQGID